LSGGGPPYREIAGEAAESLFGSASHRYFFHNRFDRVLGCMRYCFLSRIVGSGGAADIASLFCCSTT
jgi:hypothetical protein